MKKRHVEEVPVGEFERATVGNVTTGESYRGLDFITFCDIAVYCRKTFYEFFQDERKQAHKFGNLCTFTRHYSRINSGNLC